MLIQNIYNCKQANAINTRQFNFPAYNFHITLREAHWQPVHSNNLQTTPTEDMNRSFTRTTNTSAGITSAEAAAFFEQQSTNSSTADITVNSEILVDMDESITSRSALYWGHISIKHFQQRIISSWSQKIQFVYTKRHNRAKENRRDDKEWLQTDLNSNRSTTNFLIFGTQESGPSVPGEARAKNCNCKKTKS